MKTLIFFTLVVLFVGEMALADPVLTPANTLDQLLKRVVEQTNAENIINNERLEEFTQATEKQENLLEAARQTNRSLETESDDLNVQISTNEQRLSELEDQLVKRLGNFGELFGVTRQVANDTHAQIKQSLISAELPGREKKIADIAASKALPTIDQLRDLWITLLQEQTEQGKVRRFSATFADEKGFSETRDVIRVGPFSAVSDSGFLVYDGETGQLSQLPRQPASRYQQSLQNLRMGSDGDVVNAVIDPSRGAILNLLVKTPSLLERFHQGGLPGYVVSILAVIGLSIGVYRLLILFWLGKKIARQKSDKVASTNNPLGRVLRVYELNPSIDLDTLSLKLEEVVLKEVSMLERGLSTLKVLAAVAPLIGLLGTVVGMILTFQAITLWGTGEPKIMAGGISQALVTTVQGLIAAIPLLLLHSLTSGQARLLQNTLEEQSAGIIARRAEVSHG